MSTTAPPADAHDLAIQEKLTALEEVLRAAEKADGRSVIFSVRGNTLAVFRNARRITTSGIEPLKL